MDHTFTHPRKFFAFIVVACIGFVPSFTAIAGNAETTLPLGNGATGYYTGNQLSEIRQSCHLAGLAKPDLQIDELLDSYHRVTSVTVTQGVAGDPKNTSFTKHFAYDLTGSTYGYVDTPTADALLAKSVTGGGGNLPPTIAPMWIDIPWGGAAVENPVALAFPGASLAFSSGLFEDQFQSIVDAKDPNSVDYSDVHDYQLCINGQLYPISQPTISATAPTTTGNCIPFPILSPAGVLIGLGTIPAVPGGQLQTDSLSPVPKMSEFWLPNIGEAGKPVTVYGPFGGDISSTQITFNQDLVKVQEETSDSILFTLPANIFGTTDLIIDDGPNHISYKYSSLGINLAGAGHALQPGESGTLQVSVLGLHSLLSPATVHVIDLNPEVATMAGGQSHSFTVQPSDGADVTKSYGMTGVTIGACNIVAYVPQQWSDQPYAGITLGAGPIAPAGGGGLAVPPTQVAGNPQPDQPNIANNPGQSTTPITTDGWFEPVQGVWQDDYDFADKATKQISKLGVAQWDAELAMVQGRPTRLYGLRPDHHENIAIKGGTFGTVAVPVRFRFTLYEQSMPPVVLYTEPESHNSLYLDGPKGPPKDFNAVLPAHDGIAKDDGKPFMFQSTGPYKIVADLIRPDDTPTGIQVTVTGLTVKTVPPKVYFVPAIVNAPSSGTAEAELSALHDTTNALATQCATTIPLWFPLTPDGFHTNVLDARDYRAYWNIRLPQRIAAGFAQQWAQLSYLDGSSRVVLVMNKDDFNAIGGDGAVAFTEDQKVIFCRSDQEADTVAHEYIHTTPFLWSSDQMVNEFGFSYHNNDDNHDADGAEIHADGFEWRQTSKHAIMGAASKIPLEWITQGSYWHLINEFVTPHDPPVVTVTGIISRDGGHYSGTLGSLYDMDGAVDLTSGTRTDWAIVLRDTLGKVIDTYPFTAQWAVPDVPDPFSTIAISYRVPNLPETGEIELDSPTGAVARVFVSDRSPVVSITSPTNNGAARPVDGKVTVTWTGHDPDGGTLAYTVLYSPNGGFDWYPESFEQAATTAVIPLENGQTNPEVKVIATNGSRSSEALVKFTLK